MAALPEEADVVVIGGGIVGASVAYFTRKSGIERVVLIDRGLFGSGSSSRAAGGVRQQFSTEVNVRLSQKSLAFYRRFEQELGIDAGFRQSGYLFLLTDGRAWKAFQRSAIMQRDLGVPTRLLDRAGAQELVPQLVVDDVLGATYCPTDGFADPGSAVEGFVTGARAAGVVCRDETAVIGIQLGDGRVAAVQTAAGSVRTPVVVNCAGAFAASIGHMVGLELPVLPYRRQIFVTEPFDDLPEEMPLTVDFGTKFYCRREGRAVLMGMDDPKEPSGEDTATTVAFLERLIEAATRRIPALA
ncbi:MAG TPA: FAD-dependent oxidoreductase, partial [Dehalococcoidia bacterium]